MYSLVDMNKKHVVKLHEINIPQLMIVCTIV